MKNFVKTMSEIAGKCFLAFLGAGALIVGVYFDYSFLDAVLSPGHISMNALEWVVSIWMISIPTIIGVAWVYDTIEKCIKRIKSTKGKRVAA